MQHYLDVLIGQLFQAAEKGECWRQLGAGVYLDLTTCKGIPAEGKKVTTHEAHGVIVSAATMEGYAMASMVLRPAVTTVAVGLSKDPTIPAGAFTCTDVHEKAEPRVEGMVGTLGDCKRGCEFHREGFSPCQFPHLPPTLSVYTLADPSLCHSPYWPRAT